MDVQTIANRGELSGLDLSKLTSLDWIVLDLSDGRRSFGEIARLLPVSAEDLSQSYSHLRELGALHWGSESSGRAARLRDLMPDGMATLERRPSSLAADKSSAGQTQRNWATNRMFDEAGVGLRPQSARPLPEAHASAPVSSVSSVSSVLSALRTPRDVEDSACGQYLPRHLFEDFRSFEPKLLDASLDLPLDVQMFAEYIYEHLSVLTAAELLGLEEDEITRVLVKQAYMMRTRQFHPDRYFRKNIGVFAPRIAAIFKAVTGAFASLQTKAR